jgi:hypothetical protein
MNRSRELQHTGVRLLGALLAGGYFQLAAGGVPHQINFRRIYADESKPYGFFEVDVTDLPMGIQVDSLSKPDTIRFLSTVIGLPIKAINGQSLTYCVKLPDK